jgi:hypothetical protein
MSNVHILPDENLGGGPNGQILREFVEVDRNADIGEKIVIVDPSYFQYGDWYTKGTVMTVTETDEYGNVYCGKYDLIDKDEYRTLEPTDVVRIKETYEHGKWDYIRYRLVDRKAKAGEKVIVVDAYINGESYKNGDIFVVREARHSVIFVTIGSGRHIALSHFEYNVLEPVEPAQTAEPEPVEVDTRHASPQVVDMLANLAQRITEIERKLDDFKTFISRIDFIENEIDTLHGNQRKLAEEFEVTKNTVKDAQVRVIGIDEHNDVLIDRINNAEERLDRHSERIRELAEMIGDKKPCFKTFHDEELVKRLAAVLHQVLRDNERDGESE